jgi:hypothetical protein
MTAAPWIDKRGGAVAFAASCLGRRRGQAAEIQTVAPRSILRRRRGIGSWGGWQSIATVPNGGDGDPDDDKTLDQ